MFRVICLVMGYFMGCIQSSYIIGKLFYKIDIREHGSGNAGTTNITRVLGAKAGIAVFALDILKAALAFLLASLIYKSSCVFFEGNQELNVLPGLYCGFGTIIGHNFPFYMKFKGGKGIASTVGTLLFMDVRVSWICYILAIVSIFATRYVSVASLLLTGLFPFLMILFGFSTEAIFVGFLITIMGWFQHRTNIKRLFSGNENKFSVKKRDKGDDKNE